MRVNNTPAAKVTGLKRADKGTTSAPAAAAPAGGAALQSAALAPALKALAEMPELDMDRVAELRDALARGDVPFDAGKLAGLITRFHGGRA